MDQRIRDKLDALPASPGVYVFRGHDGGVLYVGKARSLRSRVRSYFQEGNSDTRYFIALLATTLGDVETYVLRTEKEAALLENQLIKELKPHYNVRLRDDKEFLSLRLPVKDAWPRLEVVRRAAPDGSRYFGPFHSATAARQTLRLVNRHFQLRTCTDSEMKARTRPCLQHQIKRCPAPCVLPVSAEEYGVQVESVALFLDGRHDELIEQLEVRMRDASAALEYEEAALFRDQIRAIDSVREAQRVSTVSAQDQDVIGFFRQADQVEMALLRLRRGRLVSVQTFDLRDVALPDEEVLASFITSYYVDGTYVPHEIILQVPIEAMEGFEEYLSERRGGRVHVIHPQRGDRVKLVALATENAVHAFKEKAREREDVDRRLKEVQDRIDLPTLPRRIECIDVSHSAGEDTVASIVALLDGAPDRDRYRSFHVKTVKGGDDYGAMHEVLSRRIRRGREKEKGWEFPDVLMVDGGKGQLNIAVDVLTSLGVTDLPVISIAKEKDNLAGGRVFDRIYVPGAKNAIQLRESSPALQMLVLARDEAHRASNALRETLGKRRSFRSELDHIPGVGQKTRTRLLRHFGSMEALRAADEEALRAAGATAAQAAAIRTALPGGGAVTVQHEGTEDDAIASAFVHGDDEPSGQTSD